MRINARLDEKTSEMLAYLRSKTQGHTTDVIKRALALYYEQIKSQSCEGPQQLLNSSFVGCAAGEPSLSSNYKSALTESLSQKYADSAVHDAK